MRKRRGLLEKDHPQISQRRQAALLAVARSSTDCQPVPEREADRRVMRLMDGLYPKAPYPGSRPLVTLLERDHGILIKPQAGAAVVAGDGLGSALVPPPDHDPRPEPRQVSLCVAE